MTLWINLSVRTKVRLQEVEESLSCKEAEIATPLKNLSTKKSGPRKGTDVS